MHQQLKEKLWAYIVQNNPDLMHQLQDEYHVVKYLEEKVSSVMPLAMSYLEKNIPGYAIVELCMEEMTKDLKPSRYNYIVSILSEKFAEKYSQLRENGLLAYEAVNLVEYCKAVFDDFRFNEENKDKSMMVQHAVTAKIREYFVQSDPNRA